MNIHGALTSADKLNIFISSTIEECAAERLRAKEAVQSINHNPILFEQIGARSYSPRDLYLSKLFYSQIFVGIYRESYGWTAPAAQVSGLDEELRVAIELGIPKLLYVLDPAPNRDARLSAMLQSIADAGNVTYARYSEPNELLSLIRDDLTAVVTDQFYKGQQGLEISSAPIDEGPTALLEVNVIPRRAKEEALSALQNSSVVCITSQAGGGKTTFLRSLSQDEGFLYVSGTTGSRKEIATSIVNKILRLNGENPKYFASAENAIGVLVATWRQSATPFTLAFDDCRDSAFLLDLIASAGVNNERRLIYALRSEACLHGHTSIALPPFTREETKKFLEANGNRLEEHGLTELQEVSRGNPLYLSYFVRTGSRNIKESVAAFETGYYDNLSPLSKETLAYVSMADGVLSLQDLLKLTGAELEKVALSLESAQLFIRKVDVTYQFAHQHTRQTLLQFLKSEQHKFGYYSQRLKDLLITRRDFARAFLVAAQASLALSLQAASEAAFDASVQGDFGRLDLIANTAVELARSKGSPNDLAEHLLNSFMARLSTGQTEAARARLAELEKLTPALLHKTTSFRIREAAAWFAAVSELTEASLDKFRALRSELLKSGDEWAAARVGIDLAALLIRVHLFEEAAEVSRSSITAMEKSEDSYGLSLAKRNLASALIASGSDKDALDPLLTELENVNSPRERAWLCNILARRLRTAGQWEEASAKAREAIEIGKSLEDVYLVAINTINLGNALRDGDQLIEALDAYSEASTLAQRTSDRALEASALRLSATVLLRLERVQEAYGFAQQAVQLLTNTADRVGQADALEVLADVYAAKREDKEAANAYLSAAGAIRETDSYDYSRLLVNALSLLGKTPNYELYLNGIEQGLGFKSTLPDYGSRLIEAAVALAQVPDPRFILRLFGIHFAQVFPVELPPLAARYTFRTAWRRLLQPTGPGLQLKQLLALIPLLTSIPIDILVASDLVEVAEKICKQHPHIHFKPSPDGSANWTFSVRINDKPCLFSVSVLDDRVDTNVVALLLTIFLVAFNNTIDQILNLGFITRSEINVVIVNSEEAIRNIPILKEESALEEIVTVSRAAHPKVYRDTPIIVFCRDISCHWRGGTGRSSALQTLYGLFLKEVAYMLLDGEVENESLRPKIVEVVRKTIS